jgi:hypothetical protein
MKIINSIDNGVTSTNGILFKIGGVAALMAMQNISFSEW